MKSEIKMKTENALVRLKMRIKMRMPRECISNLVRIKMKTENALIRLKMRIKMRMPRGLCIP